MLSKHNSSKNESYFCLSYLMKSRNNCSSGLHRVIVCPAQIENLNSALSLVGQRCGTKRMPSDMGTWQKFISQKGGPVCEPNTDKRIGQNEEAFSDLYSIERILVNTLKKFGDKLHVCYRALSHWHQFTDTNIRVLCKTGTGFGLIVPGEDCKEKYNVFLLVVPLFYFCKSSKINKFFTNMLHTTFLRDKNETVFSINNSLTNTHSFFKSKLLYTKNYVTHILNYVKCFIVLVYYLINKSLYNNSKIIFSLLVYNSAKTR